MSNNSKGPLPGLVVGIVVVAALATLTVQGGWVLWIPTLMAVAMLATIAKGLSR